MLSWSSAGSNSVRLSREDNLEDWLIDRIRRGEARSNDRSGTGELFDKCRSDILRLMPVFNLRSILIGLPRPGFCDPRSMLFVFVSFST